MTTIALTGPDWARGCPSCSFGIVAAPDIVRALPMYESRAVQAHEEMILFCDCKAGLLYRQHLRRVYSGFGMEQARNILAHVNAAVMSTIHYDQTAKEPA